MYLVTCSILFLIAATIKDVRRECLAIFIVNTAVYLAMLNLSYDGNALYWIRAVITTIGAVYLCRCRSFFGFYQAAIYTLTLLVYLALAYDVSSYNQWIESGGVEPVALVWGDTYEGLIYGLVASQFAGFLPVLWVGYGANVSSYCHNLTDNFRSKAGNK